MAQSVRALQFGVRHVIIIVLQGGIFFANLQGMAFLTQSNIQVGRALQWSGNPYGNGYGLEMDGNGAHFVKMLWIGLDLG